LPSFLPFFDVVDSEFHERIGFSMVDPDREGFQVDELDMKYSSQELARIQVVASFTRSA
jgi:hypothetical protein